MTSKARTVQKFPQMLGGSREGAGLDTDQVRALHLLRKLVRVWPGSLGLVFHSDGGGWVKVVDIRGEVNKKTFTEDPATMSSVERVLLPLVGCD